jgi:hypothetical protein
VLPGTNPAQADLKFIAGQWHSRDISNTILENINKALLYVNAVYN